MGIVSCRRGIMGNNLNSGVDVDADELESFDIDIEEFEMMDEDERSD